MGVSRDLLGLFPNTYSCLKDIQIPISFILKGFFWRMMEVGLFFDLGVFPHLKIKSPSEPTHGGGSDGLLYLCFGTIEASDGSAYRSPCGLRP